MTPFAATEFPGSRHVAGWWKQLAPFCPRSFWVAHLVLHQVEALVRTRHTVPLDDFARHFLHGVGIGGALDRLAERFGISSSIVGRMLGPWIEAGLVEVSGDQNRLTRAGWLAMERGSFERPGQERRVFHFVERGPGRSPHFLRLPQPIDLAAVADASEFHVEALTDCLGRPDEWKRQHAFPGEVVEIVRSDPAAGRPDSWQSVILDSPFRLTAALVGLVCLSGCSTPPTPPASIPPAEAPAPPAPSASLSRADALIEDLKRREAAQAEADRRTPPPPAPRLPVTVIPQAPPAIVPVTTTAAPSPSTAAALPPKTG